MKKLLILFICIITGCASVLPNIEPVTGEVASLIVEIEDTKDNLYLKANSWAVDIFVSAESVIEFHDKESGFIKGKYIFEVVDGVYFYDVKTTITIQVKDGKAKILLVNPLSNCTGDALNGTYPIPKGYRPIDNQAILDKSGHHWEGLIKSFTAAMKADKPSW